MVSPLLANIYINRMLCHWRQTGASQRLGRIVSYADDFVILCGSQLQAQQSLEQVTRWLVKLGLAIHPDKTRLCFAWESSFDFLGYTFGPMRHWRTGKRFLGAQPSKKAQKRLKEKVNTLLYRGNPVPWPELRIRLNLLLRGWANYFSFGLTGNTDTAIWRHVAQRARRFLLKRHKLRPQGAGRFSTWEIYGSAGGFDLCKYRHVRRLVHAPREPVRKPDALVAHVRFDERRRETEPWLGY